MTLNLSGSSPSVDACINNTNLYGGFPAMYMGAIAAAITAANATSGGITAGRFLPALGVPAVGTGIAGYVMTMCDMSIVSGGALLACVNETLLGTLTVSGNSFADGAAMPTKKVRGGSVQTGTQLAMLVADAALTATTPVLTITYTDQDGNTGQTATMTLPTSPAVQSAFLINPHLASGDTGIRDVTNMSISTGSAGTLKVYGGLILGMGLIATGSVPQGLEPFSSPMVPWVNEPGDTIAFYRFGITNATDIWACLAGTPEPSS